MADDDELLVPPSEKKNRFKWNQKRDDHQTITVSSHDMPLILADPSVHHMSTANTCTESSHDVVVAQPELSKNPVCVEPMPRNYTALSVFTLLCCCCCLPLGLCALFYARDAQTMWLHGRTQEAEKRARTSRNLNIAGIVISSVMMVTYVTVAAIRIMSFINNTETMSGSEVSQTPQPWK